MSYTPLEDWLSPLGKDEISVLWKQLNLDHLIGSSNARHASTLARDIVSFFDCETLAQKCIREALLYAWEKPAAKLCQQHDTVNRKQGLWWEKLCPTWRRGSRMAHSFCEAFNLDPIYAGVKPIKKPPTIEVLSPPQKLLPLADFQKDLSRQIYDTLRQGAAAKAIASLPTGAGKTRTHWKRSLSFKRNTAVSFFGSRQLGKFANRPHLATRVFTRKSNPTLTEEYIGFGGIIN
jgi:hypothetical protein